MKSIKYIAILLLALMSCEERSKKIVRNDAIQTELKKDSTKIEIADLPIRIDSTNYLIHPVGNVQHYGSRSSLYKSSDASRGYTSYDVSRYNNYSFSGDLTNLKFQHLDSLKLIPLTKKIIKITSVTFIKAIAQKTGSEFLIYTIYDQDTNADLELDFEDVKTLYISQINGSNFKKLTSNLNQLIDWKVIPELSRLYFRSITDTNKNGSFDKSDTINYRYINLEDPNLKVTTYNPI